jgi:polysaccharide pyruvyl transferase WcaK-like protein
LDLGYNCPEVYGDPAILLPEHYKPIVEKRYKLGIIPHYIDYKLVKAALKNNEQIKVINLLTKSVEATTNEILECHNIISSSLHGVIVSQAYGIPALWVKFSNKLSGDNIKFYDYYQSVNIDFNSEQTVLEDHMNYDAFYKLLETNKNVLLPEASVLEMRKRELMQHCPF